MSTWSRDNKTPNRDVMHQRIAAGTVGGEHATPLGFASGTLNAVVDDTDTRILYGSIGGGAADFVQTQGNLLNDNHTETIIGGSDDPADFGDSLSGAQFKFTGTSIGVLGGRNPYSGILHVEIDGEEAPGRLPSFLSLFIGNASVNSPVVEVGDTTIIAYGTNPAFASAGTFLLGSELITYSGITTDGDGNYNFTGCTRGALGTTATEHLASETLFVWNSQIDLSTATDYSAKQLLYYNPLLAPGEHTIVIYVTAGAGGYSKMYFDGFVTGSLVGAQNLFTQTGTITVDCICDANGHGIMGDLFYTASNVTIIGILGYTQVSAESSNTTSLAKLGMTRNSSYLNGVTWPYFYLHNGPVGSVRIIITFSYIGETI